MCVIIIKPKGADYPDAADIKNCWDANPDGAGLMYPVDGKVKIVKGLMTYKALDRAIRKARKDAQGAPMIIHCRIATHGKIQPACTHPFPLAALSTMRKTSQSCNLACAHNGIIHGQATDDNTSDTMAYLDSIVRPLASKTDIFRDKWAKRVIEATCGLSKLAFLDGRGRLLMIGSYIEHDGCQYSNTSYLTWGGKYGYGCWGVDDDYPADAYKPGVRYSGNYRATTKATKVDAKLPLPSDACYTCALLEDCDNNGAICGTGLEDYVMHDNLFFDE